MMSNKKLLLAGLLGLALLVGGVSLYRMSGGEAEAGVAYAETAQAETAVPDTTWFVRCNKEEDAKASSKRGKCEMFQRQDMKETGQRVLEFAIGYPDDAKQARGILILPLGIYLPAGAQMKIGENDPFKFEIRTCTPQGCVAFLNLTEPVLEIFKKGEKATVYMVQGDGKTVGLDIPLRGFSKTLKEISS